MEDIVKLCECGCGSPAPIATKTNKQSGWVKGQPKRFCHNHHCRGKISPLRGRKAAYLSQTEDELSNHLCECGCGQYTYMARHTNDKCYAIKGEPKKYLNGHNFRGKPSHLRGKKQSLDQIIKRIKTKGKTITWSPFLKDIMVSFSKKGNRWFCRGTKNRQTHAKVVYERYCSAVPDGYHVHHKNGDPSKLEHDHPDNLMLVPEEWNLRFFPVLAKGFNISESEVTKAYCELIEKTTPNLLFASMCEYLLKMRNN